jgi:hypothetical protein
MAAEAMSREFRDSGFGWKRPRLPCLERSADAENALFFGAPDSDTGSGGFVLGCMRRGIPEPHRILGRL